GEFAPLRIGASAHDRRARFSSRPPPCPPPSLACDELPAAGQTASYDDGVDDARWPDRERELVEGTGVERFPRLPRIRLDLVDRDLGLRVPDRRRVTEKRV